MAISYQVGDKLLEVAIKGPQSGPCTIAIRSPIETDATVSATLTGEVRHLHGAVYLAMFDGRAEKTTLVREGDRILVHVRGQTFAIVSPEGVEKSQRRGSRVDAQQHVTPPMPGQVIQIEVAVGDEVKKGQKVLVISAMKMETPLMSPRDGTVHAINTTIGAQVNPGDVLLDIS